MNIFRNYYYRISFIVSTCLIKIKKKRKKPIRKFDNGYYIIIYYYINKLPYKTLFTVHILLYFE